MMSKAKILSIAFAAVLVLTMAVGGTVLAAEGDTTTPPVCDEENHPGRAGVGFLGSCTADVADLLGLTTEEIRELRVEGQSLVDFAAAQGVSEAELVSVMTAGMTENLAERVADGTITQEQADVMLANLTERVDAMITATTPVMGRARTADSEQGKAYQAGFKKGFRHGFQAGYGTIDGEAPADTSEFGRSRGFAASRSFMQGFTN
jgi:hypothetical protein